MINNKVPQLFEVKESLGPLESEVMRVVWTKKRASVREVTETIRKKKTIAYTTIMTIMDTLFKKGFLTRQKVGKAYQYNAVAPKKIFLNNTFLPMVKDLIEKYGRARVVLATFQVELAYFKQLKTPILFPVKISRHKPVWFWRKKTPAVYGMTFALLGTILAYSVWELIQNLQFFGTMEYVNLALSEPALVIERLNLVTLAIFESLPVVNISATIVFFVLFVFVGKKVSKITDRNIFPRL